MNEQFEKALDVMEKTHRHVFVTGKAGTGKSTLLDYFVRLTKKNVVILAPTGIAAINVGGVTIHSFFRFKPDITPEKVAKIRKKKKQSSSIYKKIDAIIIDEISMVRADLLDCVDKFLRLNGPVSTMPFGGVQMIFIGDLYQLPPVSTTVEKTLFKHHYKSEFFFSAKVFDGFAMDFIELEKVYRQKDEDFIKTLNTIRNNSATQKELDILNTRYFPEFEPDGDYFIHLTTTNKMAHATNLTHLEKLSTESREFAGEIDGNFDKKNLPTEIQLNLKVGAQVMMLNNDPLGRWVNGTIAKVVDIGKEVILIALQDGSQEEVAKHTWEIFSFNYNEQSNAIDSEIIGSFKQFPLKLAWAITIHKSQGKTFDNVIIDIGNGTFAHGQMYVALSRCRSLDGMVLRKPISKNHILMDWRVIDFVTKYQYRISEYKTPIEKKIKIIEDCIKNKKKLEITYLKARDEKSKRIITPINVGEMAYADKLFVGVKGHCETRGENRTFRVDRILELIPHKS